MDAIRAYLGGVQVKLCGAVQYLNLIGIAIGYTILSYISMMGKEKSNYFHTKGHDSPCHVSSNSYAYMIAFGVVQIFLSQISDFDQISWLSNVAAVMSFTYYAIGLGLAISKVAENGRIKGSLTRVSIGVATEMQKVWRSFQTLGAIHYKKKKDFPMELPTNFFGSALPMECRRICRRLCVTDETKHVRHRRNQAHKHFVKNCRLFTDGQCLIDEQDERYRKQQQRYDEQNLLEQIYRSLHRDDRPPRP